MIALLNFDGHLLAWTIRGACIALAIVLFALGCAPRQHRPDSLTDTQSNSNHEPGDAA